MSEPAAEPTEVRKLVIGLTGNIATGKSAVMRLAREQGVATIDADKVVHQVMDTNAEIQAALAVAFGPDVRRGDGRIDRRKLGAIVFKDAAALRDLEEMVLPAVRSAIIDQIVQLEADVVMLEAIKLLDGPLSKLCHQVWVTRCSKQKQLERLMVCRGMDAETAATRIRAQAPQEEKVALADVVIDTEGLMTDTEAQFRLHWRRLPDPVTVKPLNLTQIQKRVESKITAKAGKAAAPPASAKAGATAGAAATTPQPLPPAVDPQDKPELPEGVEARRARPSDIPSMMLLIQKATDGQVKLKRAEMLMALSERGYVIGQDGSEIGALMGWSLESQVARIDQMYLYPMAADNVTAIAILNQIQTSAYNHMGEVIVAFVPVDGPDALRQLFAGQSYQVAVVEQMPPTWQTAVKESQPENTIIMLKVLRDFRLNRVAR